MAHKSRTIPGESVSGVSRGGGSETIDWIRNGPMLLQRSYTKYEGGYPLTSYLENNRVYRPPDSFITGSPQSDSTVKAAGTTAAARSNPTSPSVNLLTSAGELTNDGLPNPADFLRWKNTLRDILKDLAKHHVAIQFAWLPLWGEIRAYLKQVQDAGQIMRHAKQLAAKDKIKVGYSYPIDLTQDGHFATSNGRIWTSGTQTGNLAQASYYRRNTSKVWFEAEYLNFLPLSGSDYDSVKERADYARYVLGLNMSPHFLWELAPWSWAVDWVTNFGDILQSVSENLTDGLVMKDAFVMHHFSQESWMECYTPHMSGDGKIARFSPTKSYSLSETKKRFASVPYFGFGSVGELTPRQLSILAALGISKLA